MWLCACWSLHCNARCPRIGGEHARPHQHQSGCVHRFGEAPQLSPSSIVVVVVGASAREACGHVLQPVATAAKDSHSRDERALIRWRLVSPSPSTALLVPPQAVLGRGHLVVSSGLAACRRHCGVLSSERWGGEGAEGADDGGGWRVRECESARVRECERENARARGSRVPIPAPAYRAPPQESQLRPPLLIRPPHPTGLARDAVVCTGSVHRRGCGGHQLWLLGVLWFGICIGMMRVPETETLGAREIE